MTGAPPAFSGCIIQPRLLSHQISKPTSTRRRKRRKGDIPRFSFAPCSRRSRRRRTRDMFLTSLHDFERHGKRAAPILSGHHEVGLAPDSGDE